MIRTALLRRTALRRVSKKRVAQRYDYQQARAVAWHRDSGQCQAATVWPELACDGIRDPHHIASRRMYPELICDPSNLTTLCRAHHTAAHRDTRLARRRGLIR